MQHIFFDYWPNNSSNSRTLKTPWTVATVAFNVSCASWSKRPKEIDSWQWLQLASKGEHRHFYTLRPGKPQSMFKKSNTFPKSCIVFEPCLLEEGFFENGVRITSLEAYCIHIIYIYVYNVHVDAKYYTWYTYESCSMNTMNIYIYTYIHIYIYT